MLDYVYGGQSHVSDRISRPSTVLGNGNIEGDLVLAGRSSTPSSLPPLRRAAAHRAFLGYGGGGVGRDRIQSEPHAQYEVKPDGTIVR